MIVNTRNNSVIVCWDILLISFHFFSVISFFNQIIAPQLFGYEQVAKRIANIRLTLLFASVLLISHLCMNLSWKVPAVHVSFDEFIINCVYIKKQINELHIPIKKIYNHDFRGFFLCNFTERQKKSGNKYGNYDRYVVFLIEDNLKQFQKILQLL